MKRTARKSEYRSAVGQMQIRSLNEIRKCERTFVPKRPPRVPVSGEILTRREKISLRVDLLQARKDFTPEDLNLAKRALRRMGFKN